jgi:hypothetical protein
MADRHAYIVLMAAKYTSLTHTYILAVMDAAEDKSPFTIATIALPRGEREEEKKEPNPAASPHT